MNNNILNDIITTVLDKCLQYTKLESDGQLYFIDPHECKEISAHYGATHAAAAYIIYGSLYGDKYYHIGVDLLQSILNRYEASAQLPAFHADFNNFALSVIYVHLKDEVMKKRIIDVVIHTPDSNHSTVNWLPMRWYVNEMRYKWTSDVKYRTACINCKNQIEEATNEDGSIEDRLPKGISFNLQYDVSTVATLQFLKNLGVDNDLSTELGFLFETVLPDGDINYQGRGCNQIFAWGPWIYLLASSGLLTELEKAESFLSPSKIVDLLNNDNILLNKFSGKDRYLWWDYHYASVYIAHFLFWIVLAQRDFGKYEIKSKHLLSSDSGFHVKKDQEAFIAWFDGRKEYLAEAGPSISAICNRRNGVIFKGSFGPWQGLFGNTHTYEDVVLKNFLGVLGISLNKDFSKSRILKRIFLKSQEFGKLEPQFLPIKIDSEEGVVSITWSSVKPLYAIFNAPLCSEDINFKLFIDGKEEYMFCVGRLNNQYGERFLYQSHTLRASKWVLKIFSE